MPQDIYILVKQLDKIQNLPKGAHICCFASPEDSHSMKTLVWEVRPPPFLTEDRLKTINYLSILVYLDIDILKYHNV